MSLVLAAALAVASSLAPAAAASPAAVEATHFYPRDADAHAMVETALADAAGSGRIAIIVFGADWCHDSRALARALTSREFRTEFGQRFTVTFVDVGTPQSGQGRNLDLARSFGIRRLKSTPALILAGADGKALNSAKDAVSWRNADSRGEAAILGWFRLAR